MQVCINDKSNEIVDLRSELDELRAKEVKWKEESERLAKEHQEIVDNFQLRLDAKELEIEQEFEKQKDLQSMHKKQTTELTQQKESERQRAEANREAYVACKALWKASRLVLKQKRERLASTNAAVVDLETNLEQQHESMVQLRSTYEEKLAETNRERNKMLEEICARNEQELGKMRDKFSAELDSEKARYLKEMEDAVQQKDEKVNELQKALQTLQEQQNRKPPPSPKNLIPTKVQEPSSPRSAAFKTTATPTESRPAKAKSLQHGDGVGKSMDKSHEQQPQVKTKFSAFQKLQKQLARSGRTGSVKLGRKSVRSRSAEKENVFEF
uniref:Uncharacterized protein n=2 Tax=Picocystis salinarum TaxID=88271 RepID=A0A7S3UE71_9CHLO